MRSPVIEPGRLRCRTVGRLLQAYLDGEVDDLRADQIAAHLEDCRRCGLQADLWRWLNGVLAGTRRGEDPERLRRLRAFVDDVTGR